MSNTDCVVTRGKGAEKEREREGVDVIVAAAFARFVVVVKSVFV